MHEFIIDKCELIAESINAVEKYFQTINIPNDFRKDQNGILYLDAIMMRLQVIGENIKKIIKLREDFFNTAVQYDVSNIVRFRDFISHHYEKTDSDIVFDICRNDIPLLRKKIIDFLNEQIKK